MTSAEKRFLRYWEEQREGGKSKYLLFLVPLFSFCILAIIFLAGIVMDIYFFLDWPWPVIAGTIILVIALCYYWVNRHWNNNEARWLRLSGKAETR
jgi:L-asparagine transporter-like permease